VHCESGDIVFNYGNTVNSNQEIYSVRSPQHAAKVESGDIYVINWINI